MQLTQQNSHRRQARCDEIHARLDDGDNRRDRLGTGGLPFRAEFVDIVAAHIDAEPDARADQTHRTRSKGDHQPDLLAQLELHLCQDGEWQTEHDDIGHNMRERDPRAQHHDVEALWSGAFCWWVPVAGGGGAHQDRRCEPGNAVCDEDDDHAVHYATRGDVHIEDAAVHEAD